MEDEKEKEILTKALTSVKVEKGADEDQDIVNTYSFFLAVASFVNILFIIGMIIILVLGVIGAVSDDSISILFYAVISAAVLWFVRLLAVYSVKWFGYMLKTNYDTVKFLKKK